MSFCNLECWDDGSIDLCFYEFDEPTQKIPMYCITIDSDFVTRLYIYQFGEWFL